MKRSTRVLIVIGGVAATVAAAIVASGVFLLNAMKHYTPSGVPNFSAGLIDHAGEYILQSKERIDVRIDDSGAVTFEFFAADGRKIISNDNDVHPSASKPWRLYLDSQKWIWLDSPDTGPRVWTMYTTGTWPSKPVRGDKELEQLAPKGFSGK